MNTQVIFVHGLGGDESTWGDFPRLIREDSELDVSISFMTYPTPFGGLKLFYFLQPKYQAIEDLAKSLKTIIDEKYRDADEIVLVGHSMGGLVIRKYLLEEVVAERQSKVSKAILYAVPNRGASLATFVGKVSLFKNPHLYQLNKQADFIKLLNESWCRARIEASVEMTIVVAGNDKIVTVDSAEGVFQHLEPKQIPGVGHVNVVKPQSSSDLSFLIFKNAVLKKKYLPNFPISLPGGCNFIGWQKLPNLSKFEFRLDNKRQEIFDALKKEFAQVRSAVRLKGLSGLGKTRLIYEAVLSSSQDIKDKVLYINVATKNPGVRSWLKQAIDSGYKGILIVDNCKPDLHKDLSDEVGRIDSQVLFVSLDHNLECISAHDAREYKIEPLDTVQIRALLEPEYGSKILDLDRVAKFAQGFPQMAVLIADARLSNDPEVGKLTDDVLAKRLLGEISEIELSILRSCSLFDNLGFSENVSNQYEYIANKAARVPPQDFYACIKKFQKRGLIDISGRYVQLIPKPLAVLLASDWWNQTRNEDQLSLLKEMPDELVEPFCLQVSMLGFIPEVQQLTLTLCGPQGPFGQAEAILSNRGSLLFRSFVEVNPIATSSALFCVLDSLSHKELSNISGDVRRNLVWALEKLVFHASIFEESAWCLMLLASAENESYSNNTTGLFAQLFRINLSGTEADFELRLRLLKRAMELGDSNVDKAIIKALGASINTYSGSRFIGAEHQGTKAPLQEWQPKFWQEIFDYWNAIFEMLIKFVERDNENSQEAQIVIGRSIREMIGYGRISMLNHAITRVIELNGRYWPYALDNIKKALLHDTQRMPEAGITALKNWLNLLTPDVTNLAERLKIIVVAPPWEHEVNEEGHYIDVAAQNAEQLAIELSTNIQDLVEHIPLLLSGEQKQALVFGRRLAIESKNIDNFLELVIAELVRIENPNISFLKGLLSGIHANSTNVWNRHLEDFLSRKELIKFYPHMLCTGEMQNHHLSNILKLIKGGYLRTDSVFVFSYGSVTAHLSGDDISSFCLALADIDAKSAWIALDIMFMHCFGNANKFAENKVSLRTLVTKVSLDYRSKSRHSDMYHWEEVTKKLLVTEGLPFCEDICRQIIAASNENLDIGDISNSIKPLLRVMMQSYGKDIWPIFSEAIISANSTQLHFLQLLLEKLDRYTNTQPSVFSILPLNLVISWCKEYLEIAPSFVASAINIFELDESGLMQPTALFVALLENFGEHPEVVSTLSANLRTRQWSGSLVPYLESDKNALTSLLQHRSRKVRSWAQKYIGYLERSIEYESMRDAEHNLGRY
ncbi:alpha/beta fold hydrolase [Nitrosomonas sp. Nm132]|uniref:alpha/beta fold hydrolase n=1 Tax=Nitrosomonas sp. Nm132 TaxID=1881053 RepID=UPI00088AF1B3|nr:alpha/beta fold hydrolase [Nitrosomonas sp. Nm132]SDH87790.1 Lecithin:cholesterol acyltransferase [Nitrosomonas sp. Nm132]